MLLLWGHPSSRALYICPINSLAVQVGPWQITLMFVVGAHKERRVDCNRMWLHSRLAKCAWRLRLCWCGEGGSVGLAGQLA